jgi:hypothetical protein
MKAMGNYIKRNWLTLLFITLYTLVTGATLRHSAAGFASLEGGSMLWGYLSALAVDAGMALSATSLSKRLSFWPFIGLLVSAVASTFTQLLYAVAHAAVMPVSAGAQWLGPTAQLIADARVVILPALLPLLSVVYSFSSKSAVESDAADIDALRDDIAQGKAELEQAQGIARQWQQKATQTAQAVEAWGLLSKTARAELIARCANGDRPDTVVVADALGASTATVNRGYQLARDAQEVNE